jgi:drug/metabolite transporter (DMT)-like permease
MSDNLLGYGLASLGLLFFTSGILVTKLAANRISLSLGFVITAATNVVFAGLAFVLQLFARQDGLQWNGQAFLLFALAGGFATYLGRWFFYEAVVRFGPSRASVFQVSSPLFTALIAWLLLGERLSPLLLMGIVITIAGLVLVSYRPGFFSRSQLAVDAAGERVSLGQRLVQSVVVLGFGSSLAYAIGNVLRGSAVRLWNEPLLGVMLGAIFGLALHLVFTSGKPQLLAKLRTADRRGAWLYVLMGITTISGQACAIAAMRYIPLSIATLVTLCTPVLVFPLSYLLFKNSEEINQVTLLGCGLTLLGIFAIVLR